MVSATPSGGWLQSSPVIPGLGFCLGTRGQMFWLRPGLPNSLEPGKRPRTTLSPSFALRDGKPWMAFGTPGGEQQDQWSLILFLRMVHHNMGIQEAIDAPSFHTEHWPSSFWPRVARPGKVVIEGRYPDDRCWPSCWRAATRRRKATTGAKAGCPPRGVNPTGRCSPAPILAACKATRWDADAHPVQPGPVHPARFDSLPGRAAALHYTLAPGLTLNEALTAPLVAAGMQSATVTFGGGVRWRRSAMSCRGHQTARPHVAYFTRAARPRGRNARRYRQRHVWVGWRQAVRAYPRRLDRSGRQPPRRPHAAARLHRRCAKCQRTPGVCRDPRWQPQPMPETNFTLFQPSGRSAAERARRVRPHPPEPGHSARRRGDRATARSAQRGCARQPGQPDRRAIQPTAAPLPITRRK